MPALTALDPTTPLFAVGDATAARAQASGFTRVESAGRDAASLAGLVTQRCRPGARLLLASGARQGQELAATLRAKGFSVIRRIAYAASPARSLPSAARLALAERRVCAVLFFSAETAHAFAQAFAAAQARDTALHPGVLTDVEALAISNPVRSALFHLPWRRIRVASHPNQDELVALLP